MTVSSFCESRNGPYTNFRHAIIVTPTTNAKPKSQFIAYRCIKKTDLENTAYEAYLKEIEWALSSGTEVIGAH